MHYSTHSLRAVLPIILALSLFASPSIGIAESPRSETLFVAMEVQLHSAELITVVTRSGKFAIYENRWLLKEPIGIVPVVNSREKVPIITFHSVSYDADWVPHLGKKIGVVSGMSGEIELANGLFTVRVTEITSTFREKWGCNNTSRPALDADLCILACEHGAVAALAVSMPCGSCSAIPCEP